MKKKIAVSIIAASVMLSCYSPLGSQVRAADSLKYSDMTGHWSEKAVIELLNKKALPYNDSQFIADKSVTRGEFAYMLRQALDIEINYFAAPNIKDYYSDVDKDSPYAASIIDLVTANVFEKGGSFNPDRPVTREEMVHYIMNAYKYKMGDKYVMINIIPHIFADNSDITVEYSGEIARAAHYKLVQGDENNFFNPKAAATRSESAVVIANLLKLLDQQVKSDVSIQPSVNVGSEYIEMSIMLTNNTDKPVVFTHSSGLKYDFVLLDSDSKELYKWSDGKVFTMALIDTTIDAGKSIEFKEKLDGNDYKKIKDKAAFLKAYVIGSSDSFNINQDGYVIPVK